MDVHGAILAEGLPAESCPDTRSAAIARRTGGDQQFLAVHRGRAPSIATAGSAIRYYPGGHGDLSLGSHGREIHYR